MHRNLERTHDNSGADTNFGMFAVAAHGGGNNCNTRVIPYSGSMFNASNQFNGFRQSNLTSSVMGTEVGVFPIFPFYIVAMNPSCQLVSHYSGDISSGTVFTAPMYGASHEWFVTRAIRGAYDQDRCSIRWDS